MKAIKIFGLAAALILLVSGCKKSDYYLDGGTQNGTFNGSVMQFLESKPELFRQLAGVVRYAGLEQALSSEQVTFFAPADSSIRKTIEFANIMLPLFGKPAISEITDIKPAIWRKYLARYIFKGSKSLSDYAQLDPGNLSAYSGQMFSSYDGEPMNIGVVFTDANGVKYAGYRYLMISYVNSSTPRDYTTWRVAVVASSNIKADNGYIHALRFADFEFEFGFSAIGFVEDIIYNN
ncbi:MAG: fasciclin domain-containing protein [Niabella sp.]